LSYRFTKKAEADLMTILLYTRRTWGDAQTTAYLADLVEAFEMLADFPRAGRTRDGTQRELVKGRHIIFYRETDDGILIQRIMHGAQRR